MTAATEISRRDPASFGGRPPAAVSQATAIEQSRAIAAVHRSRGPYPLHEPEQEQNSDGIMRAVLGCERRNGEQDQQGGHVANNGHRLSRQIR